MAIGSFGPGSLMASRMAPLSLISTCALVALALVGQGVGQAQTAAKTPSDCAPTFSVNGNQQSVAVSEGQSEKANPDYYQIGDRIDLKFNNLAALFADRDCLESIDHKSHPIVLYLDGTPFPDAIIVPAGPPSLNEGYFRLEYTADSRDAWRPILAKTKFASPREVHASAGVIDQYAVDGGTPIYLATLPRLPTIAAGIAVGVLLILFIGLIMWKPSIVRESRVDPQTGNVVAGAYSLSRAQAAWWFFIVLGSYLFLAVVSGGFITTFNNTALVLLAIGAATVVGSNMISGSAKQAASEDVKQKQVAATAADDAVKSLPSADLAASDTRLANAVTELAVKQSASDAAQTASAAAPSDAGRAAEAKKAKADLDAASQARDDAQKANNTLRKALVDQASAAGALKDARNHLHAMSAESVNPLEDILSDADGVSFHRFQMVVWTVILGGVFVYEVWATVAMPEFDAQLLWLQGISAGTYLGLKYSEATAPTGK